MGKNNIRILVTGASGFIGRHLLGSLQATGNWPEIHAVCHSAEWPRGQNGSVVWHAADLLHPPSLDGLIAQVKPTHLIHAAWVTDHGVFWTHPDNTCWYDASLTLADAFSRHGGRRFVNLGSVAEYDWRDGRMIEGKTREEPATPYGQAKLAFHRELTARAQKAGYSAATGRIFFTYGAHEKPGRFVPSACRALITGEPEAFGSGSQWRDFLHVTDLARAIEYLTRSPLEGAVNLGSGSPMRLSDMLYVLENLSTAKGVLLKGARPDAPDDPPILFADTKRLAEIGWQPIVSLEDGLSAALDWWRSYLNP